MASFRLPSGGDIDREQPINFSFDGRNYSGYRGDTLASALLANGVTLLGRSFKYHRPRGMMMLGSAEPNALAELRGGDRREPNIQMTMVELFEGLRAQSQNRFPSLRYDIQAVNQLLSPFLVAGFYYKAFMWPSSFWEPVYEKLIRKAAGLGRAADAPDPDHYEHIHAHCDVLVIGSGPAGMSAADTAAEAGARVMLLDENAWHGGRLAFEKDNIAGTPSGAWIEKSSQRLEARSNTNVLRRTTVLGIYDHNIVTALERVSDHIDTPKPGKPRQRLWVIRPKQIVVAAGAIERPLTFANNDKPGIMLSSTARGLMNRFGVAPGRKAAIVTTNDDGYQTALELLGKNIQVEVIADTRQQPSEIAQDLIAEGVDVRLNLQSVKAKGRLAVTGLDIVSGKDQSREHFSCDTILATSGYNPTVHLLSQAGKSPVWSDEIHAFVPPDPGGAIHIAGACRGIYDTDDCIADGRFAGIQASTAIGLNSAVEPDDRPTVQMSNASPAIHLKNVGRAFVDFQNDVTEKDVRLATQEGYSSVEHLKRYTTLGMATDQGKTSNVNGMSILAEAHGQQVRTVGTTRFRPPYSPAAVGAYAGHHRGKAFQPTRKTALHHCHEEAGATFVEAGQWLRPRYYAQPGEDMLSAIKREAKAVRTGVGVCDVSTLGKIELFGPGAAEFLNRLYINNWLKLPIGKARYGVMLREDGHVFDDGTTCRLSENHFFLTCTTANAARVLSHLDYASQVLFPELDVTYCSVTEQWCGLALAGPNSRDLLAELFPHCDVSNDGLPFMGVQETKFDGFAARIFRISFSGELAYEVNIPHGYATHFWRRLMAIGEKNALTPYGSEALGVLRIEKGHVAGPELDGRTTATDLGLGRMMAKKDFVGKALASRVGLQDDSRPALVGLKPVHRRDRLRGGAIITTASDPKMKPPVSVLGWVSSVADSPNLEHWIGLGFVERGMARLGEHLVASYPLKNEQVEVEICNPVFIDPEGVRVRE